MHRIARSRGFPHNSLESCVSYPMPNLLKSCQDFSNGLIVLKDLVRCTKSRRLSWSEAESVSAFVDEAFQLYTRAAFTSSSSNCQIRQLGANAIQLQATSSSLVAPYNQVLLRTLLYALRALTSDTSTSPNLDAAFRILQRLVTGDAGLTVIQDSIGSATPENMGELIKFSHANNNNNNSPVHPRFCKLGISRPLPYSSTAYYLPLSSPCPLFIKLMLIGWSLTSD